MSANPRVQVATINTMVGSDYILVIVNSFKSQTLGFTKSSSMVFADITVIFMIALLIN